MKTKRAHATLVAIAIALLATPAARADLREPSPGAATAQSGPKNYSKNAATGDYRALYGDGVRTSSLAGTTSATFAPPPRQPASSTERFSWGDAGIGAGAGFVLALAGTACALSIRRRARPAHP